jgi:hypothetical protein
MQARRALRKKGHNRKLVVLGIVIITSFTVVLVVISSLPKEFQLLGEGWEVKTCCLGNFERFSHESEATSDRLYLDGQLSVFWLELELDGYLEINEGDHIEIVFTEPSGDAVVSFLLDGSEVMEVDFSDFEDYKYEFTEPFNFDKIKLIPGASGIIEITTARIVLA